MRAIALNDPVPDPKFHSGRKFEIWDRFICCYFIGSQRAAYDPVPNPKLHVWEPVPTPTCGRIRFDLTWQSMEVGTIYAGNR